MRTAPISISLLLATILTGCADGGARNASVEQFEKSVNAEAGERALLTKRIEKSVALPEGALALDSYSRYYALRSDGVVVASYIIHHPEFDEFVAESCREIDETPFPCPVDGGELRLVNAGERAWTDSPLDLPYITDGGCALVHVEFSPAEDRLLRVECADSMG